MRLMVAQNASIRVDTLSDSSNAGGAGEPTVIFSAPALRVHEISIPDRGAFGSNRRVTGDCLRCRRSGMLPGLGCLSHPTPPDRPRGARAACLAIQRRCQMPHHRGGL